MRAVIFDLDGTLIDAAPDLAAKLNQVLATEGLAPLALAEVKTMIGDGAKILVERGVAARGMDMQPRHLELFLQIYPQDPIRHTVLYDGIMPVLEQLKGQGRRLGLCTNKPAAATSAVLAALRLTPFFEAVVAGDSTPYRKPDPRHLALTMAALEVTDAIMVGDHANDMKVAADLKLPSIFCRWGYGEGQGDANAASPWELPEIIANLG